MWKTLLINIAVLSFALHPAFSQTTIVFPPSGNVVGTTDTQTITGKSIDGSEINSGTISVNRFNSGTGASSTTFLNGLGQWSTPTGGGGGVTGSYTCSDITVSNGLVTAGANGACGGSGRTLLASNQSYYVNCSTGSNSNSGASSSPFADPVHAYQVAQQTLDLGGQWIVTVNLASNCSGVQWTFVGPLVGATGPGSFVITGTGQFSPVVTGAASGFAFQTQADAAITVTTLNCVPGTGGGCLLANNGVIADNNLSFTLNGGASLFDAAGPRSLILTGPFEISSGSAAINIVAVSEDHAQLVFNGALTMSGGPTWTTAFAQSDLGGMIDGTGFTFSGGIPTGPRFSAISNGIVFSGIGGCPASFWPGSTAGTTSSGGVCN